MPDSNQISNEANSSYQVPAHVIDQNSSKLTNTIGQKCKSVVAVSDNGSDLAMASKTCPGQFAQKKKVKPRRQRLMVEVYATAAHGTIKDLDRRNGTNWTGELAPQRDPIPICNEAQGDEICTDIGGFAGEGAAVYVDSNGVKVGVLSKFNDAPKKKLNKQTMVSKGMKLNKSKLIKRRCAQSRLLTTARQEKREPNPNFSINAAVPTTNWPCSVHTFKYTQRNSNNREKHSFVPFSGSSLLSKDQTREVPYESSPVSRKCRKQRSALRTGTRRSNCSWFRVTAGNSSSREITADPDSELRWQACLKEPYNVPQEKEAAQKIKDPIHCAYKPSNLSSNSEGKEVSKPCIGSRAHSSFTPYQSITSNLNPNSSLNPGPSNGSNLTFRLMGKNLTISSTNQGVVPQNITNRNNTIDLGFVGTEYPAMVPNSTITLPYMGVQPNFCSLPQIPSYNFGGRSRVLVRPEFHFGPEKERGDGSARSNQTMVIGTTGSGFGSGSGQVLFQVNPPMYHPLTML